MAGKRADRVDVLVGANIRILRQHRGMSQTTLAEHLGVTFQQVQKYEKGTNRVGSGRLFKIASIFGVPIATLFQGGGNMVTEETEASPVSLLAEPHALRLLRAFSAFESLELRRSMADLAEVVAANVPKRSSSRRRSQ